MKAYLGITCKPGTHNEVVKKLLFKLFIDPQDVYLLNGPIDILVQFSRLKSLEEFVAEWFDPVSMIGGDDNLLKKLESFIVISEGPLPTEKPFAFLFMKAQPMNRENVRTRLLTFPEVLSADSVFGSCAVISSVKAKNVVDCNRVFSNMQNIPGVKDSTASIVDATNIFPEW
jgi:hypothetical protein